MVPLTYPPPGILGARPGLSPTLLAAATAAAVWLSISFVTRRETRKQLFTPSPRFSEKDAASLPYPPDVLPGGRDIATPYGSIRVYEWGPENGGKVLLVHGISTPTVALGDLAHEFASRGYRVMLFDLFGRGYSDAPDALDYDARLYVSQILLVIASCRVPWTDFSLVGYSLGGGLCVAFTRYFPHFVNSLVLVASCGLIRPYHVGWQSRLLYNSGLLPEFLVKWLVSKRIRPKDEMSQLQPPQTAGGVNIAYAEAKKKQLPNGDGDSNGGDGFDSAAISKFRPGVTVSSVVRWQVDNHPGFVSAFISTIRNAPIYSPQDDWIVLDTILQARRRAGPSDPSSGLIGGKILVVLGNDDPVVVKDETIEDAKQALGYEGVDFAVLPGGHELPITNSSGVADAIEGFWRQ